MDKGKLQRLMSAAAGSVASMAQLIETQKLDLRSADNELPPLLYMAIEMGRFEMACFLLEQGIDPNRCFKTAGLPHNPITLAIQAASKSNKVDTLEQLPQLLSKLLAHGADPNLVHPGEPSALWTACDGAKLQNRNARILRILIEGGAHYRSGRDDETLAIRILRGNSTTLVKESLELLNTIGPALSEIAPGENKQSAWTALIYSSPRTISLVNYFLDEGAHLHGDRSPHQLARDLGHLLKVDLLASKTWMTHPSFASLEFGQEDSDQLLHAVITNSAFTVDAVNLILDKGGNPNSVVIRDGVAATPLIRLMELAPRNGQDGKAPTHNLLPVLRCLLERGADPDQVVLGPTGEEMTAMTCGILNNCAPVLIKTLLQHGALVPEALTEARIEEQGALHAENRLALAVRLEDQRLDRNTGPAAGKPTIRPPRL